MYLNKQKVRKLRDGKGWTQQHLADAAGLSLRTIQRVERDGAASKETCLILCSVFEETLERLSQNTGPDNTDGWPVKAMLVTFVIGTVFGVFVSWIIGL